MTGIEDDDEDEDGNQLIWHSATRILYDRSTDTITNDGWAEIGLFSDFLVHFYEITRRVEGNQSKSGVGSLRQATTNLQHLNDVLPEMVEEAANEARNSYL